MIIRSTRNYGIEQLKILIFGSPGVGKTTLASTTDEPTLVISFEGGLLSLSGHDVDFVDCTTADDGKILSKSERLEKLNSIYTWLQNPEQRTKYKWIFLDSITEVGQTIVEHQNQLYPDRKDALVMWGEVAKKLREVVKQWRDITGYNVVFTALTEIEKDEVGARFNGISLPGKFSAQVPAYFDEVFYYHVYKTDNGETQRVLITQPTDKVLAKDRSGKLDLMMAPDLSEIAKKIKGTTLNNSFVESQLQN